MVAVSRPTDVESLRREALAEFDRWASAIQAGLITHLNLNMRFDRGPGKRIVSWGGHDPKNDREN